MIKLSLRERGCALLLLLMFAFFGPGFQSIPLSGACFLLYYVGLVYCSERWYDFALIIIVHSVGFWLDYLYLFGRDGASVLFMSIFPIVFSTLMAITFIPPFKLLTKRYPRLSLESGGVYILPIAFTGVFSMITTWAPSGSWGNFGYFSVMDFAAFMQVTTLFGLDGVNFLLSWTVSHLFCWMTRRKRIQGTEAKKRTQRQLKRYIAVVFVVFFYSGARQLNSYGRFFQESIQDWEQDKINAVCLTGYDTEGVLRSRLNKTASVASQGLFINKADLSFDTPDLILWSEGSVSVANQAEKDVLFDGMKDIAIENNVMIGFGYMEVLEHPANGYTQKNMFSLILPNGTVGISYQKVHPVIKIEDSTEPGTDAVKPVDAGPRYGTINAAICFDYDFPDYMRKVARGASLILQPGEDWGPIGVLHARMGAMRALENGVTLFRCSSGGVSGVYDAYGNVLVETVLGSVEGETNAFTAQIPVTGAVWTLYTYLGGALGYCCVALSMLMLLLCLVPENTVRNIDLLYLFLYRPDIEMDEDPLLMQQTFDI
uniref:CN hydrolase domain-containing protein n=1 Tax=Mucochytrium quahogii TaxID=96639 RepID=A0A7S2RU04_9STRA|mmetsp:Transcript_5317/g.8203  ORF Transcript_5317/g.8203 Transcript_5317/m.8203 type:complete len:543 (+) Transcript_5317:159-1787(+)